MLKPITQLALLSVCEICPLAPCCAINSLCAKPSNATGLPGQTDPVGQAWALPDLILRAELREGELMVNQIIAV